MQVDAANVSGGRTQSQPMRRDLGGPMRLASQGRLGICPGWTQRVRSSLATAAGTEGLCAILGSLRRAKTQTTAAVVTQ